MTVQKTTLWAVFRDGRQISKPHSTEGAARAEAMECGAVVRFGYWFKLDSGCEIKRLETCNGS